MKLFDVLNEALPLSTAKSYRKSWDPFKYESLFRRFTDDPKAFRIYLPLVAGPVHISEVDVPHNIWREISLKGYTTDGANYIKGIAFKSKADDSEKDGRPPRQISIGKLLSKSPELKKEFDNDPQRQGSSDKVLVVISRHPVDIAGMSTDRGWKSCMSLRCDAHGAGGNQHYVLNDIKEGTIIAYLIKKEDKNVQDPLARLLIKPFIEHTTNNVLLVAEGRPYGRPLPGFMNTVNEWLAEVNQDKVQGVYALPDTLYNDGISNTQIKGDPKDFSKEQLISMIRRGRLDLAIPYATTPELWDEVLYMNPNRIHDLPGITREYIVSQCIRFPEILRSTKTKLTDEEAQNLLNQDPGFVMHMYQPSSTMFFKSISDLVKKDRLGAAYRVYRSLDETSPEINLFVARHMPFVLENNLRDIPASQHQAIMFEFLGNTENFKNPLMANGHGVVDFMRYLAQYIPLKPSDELITAFYNRILTDPFYSITRPFGYPFEDLVNQVERRSSHEQTIKIVSGLGPKTIVAFLALPGIHPNVIEALIDKLPTGMLASVQPLAIHSAVGHRRLIDKLKASPNLLTVFANGLNLGNYGLTYKNLREKDPELAKRINARRNQLKHNKW